MDAYLSYSMHCLVLHIAFLTRELTVTGKWWHLKPLRLLQL